MQRGDNAPMSDLRVSIVQASTIWRDAAANRALYGDWVKRLANHTDVIVLPETFMSGFGNDAIQEAEGMNGPSVAWMQEMAALTGAAITGSLVIAEGGRVVNRLVWATPDGQIQWYDKRHLFRMADEHLRYGQGEQRVIIRYGGWRILPLICYDLRFPVWSRNRVDVEGACEYDLAIYVANWPTPRRYPWQTLLRARAIENLSYVIGVNRVGTDGNGFHYSGDSAVIDPLGVPLIELNADEQAVTVVLSANDLASHRTRFPAFRDADAFEIEGLGGAVI